MTCDKVFRKILDDAFSRFTSDSYISSYDAFVESVITFFSECCNSDLHDMYSDFEFHCSNYLRCLSDSFNGDFENAQK